MDAEIERLLKMARDAIRQTEANVRRCKELCDGFQAQAAYELIGVQPGCTDEELKSAYHKKVAYWHPDKFHAADIPVEMMEYATRELARVNEAYSVLKPRRSGSETS
jgi:DnaJ-class molecular chaperone